MSKLRLVVFNLKSCQDDPIFNASVSWVEELSRRFKHIEVHSVHLGRVPTLSNVSWSELGGGNLVQRCRAILRLTKFLVRNSFSKRDFIVFHYMNHKTAVYPGAILRLMGIRQVLWYAHASSTLVLKFSEIFVDRIVTSRRSAFPLKSKKVSEIGQALTVAIPVETVPTWDNRENKVVSLGRLVPVKFLEECLEALYYNAELRLNLTNIGPQPDLTYKEKLESFMVNGTRVFFAESEVPQREAVEAVSNFKFYFSGTREAIDKAAIEAASVGCMILTTNSNLQDILNLRKKFLQLGIDQNISLQLRWYSNLSEGAAKELSKSLMQEVRTNLSLGRVIDRLIKELSSEISD